MDKTDADNGSIPISAPQIVLVTLCVLFIVSAGVAGVSSARPLGIYNTDWSGSSDFRSIAGEDGREVILRQTAEMTMTEQTVFVIIGVPERSVTTQQTARAVLASGGTVIVLDGVSTYANRFLDSIGADARVGDRPLRDLESYYRSPSLPIINSKNITLQNRSIDEFTLNHAASIKRNSATVIATSSNISYVDQNRNDQVDENESIESQVVMTREPVANGSVVLLSDASVLTNAMLDEEGNQKLARVLLDSYNQVIIGGYNKSILPTISTVILSLRRSVGYQAVALGGLFISVLGIHSLLSYFDVTMMTTEESEDTGKASAEEILASEDETEALTTGRVSLILNRHPTWDKTRVQRLMNSFVSRDGRSTSERDNDE